MNYYVGNGIYEYLTGCKEKDDFFWTSENMWLLVYGNESFEPKVLTVASGGKLGEAITEKEVRVVQMAKSLALDTGIPVNFVRFDPNCSIEKVGYLGNGMNKIHMISSDELRNRFRQYGLRMNPYAARKSINDKSSGPYHEWQRAHMGNSVVVADIDLVRLEDDNPIEIIELKRSYIALETWEPYQQDYKNFILLSKLARKRNIGFKIVYNHRTKSPFYDDVSKLKVFEFDHRRAVSCRLQGYETIQQFVENESPKEYKNGKDENEKPKHGFS